MNILATTYLCAFVLFSQGASSCNLPFSKRCKANDPNLSECWKSILEDIKQYLENGIPEIGLVPPMDPWRSKQKYVLTGETYTLGHQDMEHGGIKHFEVVENTVDLSANIIILKVRFPKIDHTCSVFANGTLLGYKFQGQDGCNEAKADVTILFVFQGKRVTRKGKEYIDFNNIDISVNGKYTQLKFYNVVAGGAVENSEFSTEARKATVIFSHIFNECIRSSVGRDMAAVLRKVYNECPLDNLHPE